MIADADFERRRARLAGRTGYRDTIRTRLFKPYGREIGVDVGLAPWALPDVLFVELDDADYLFQQFLETMEKK